MDLRETIENKIHELELKIECYKDILKDIPAPRQESTPISEQY